MTIRRLCLPFRTTSRSGGRVIRRPAPLRARAVPFAFRPSVRPQP